MADQLENRTLNLEKFARGATFVALGLAKKILLANPAGKVADTTFNAGSVGFLDAWFGAVAYAFRIYFDFSAYSDMAIGLRLMLGFVFAKNFDSPYRQARITEFLAPLAYLPLLLAEGITCTYRSEATAMDTFVPMQTLCLYVARRSVAWGFMEFCYLGRDSWWWVVAASIA